VFLISPDQTHTLYRHHRGTQRQSFLLHPTLKQVRAITELLVITLLRLAPLPAARAEELEVA
jgi:hypothetical protein